MSRWITPLLGFFLWFGVCDLQAQLSKPSYLKPSYPAVNNPYPQSRIQNAQPVPQTPIAQPAQQPDIAQPMTITADSMEQLDNTRKLSVGDRLSFQVKQDRDQPRALFVTDMGEVEFPLIGRVKAANKTLKQLAYEVKQLMDREYYYNSTVLIGLDATSKFRGRIYVIGAVAGVGPQDIPADEVFTVSKAILRAGGFGDFANQRNIRLIRKGAPGAEADPGNEKAKKEEVIVDVKAVFEGVPNAPDPVLQPDDMIVVKQKYINF